jgi:carboxypeptidase family protein
VCWPLAAGLLLSCGRAPAGPTPVAPVAASLPACAPVPGEITVGVAAPWSTPTTATIAGHVTDRATGAPMLLVTLAVRGPSQRDEFTDAKGEYAITDLPPGRYSVACFYGDARIDRGGIVIGSGERVSVDCALDMGTTGEIITIKNRTSLFDGAGDGWPQDYRKNVPPRGQPASKALPPCSGP